MDERNDFEFCMLVHDLSEVVKGNSVDKQSLLTRLAGMKITDGDEADDYRLLAALQEAEGDTLKHLCRAILTKIAKFSPKEYNPLNAATHDLLVVKRQELAKLEKEVENLELIERYRELKKIVQPDGRIGDELLDKELELLDRKFNPESYDDETD